MRLRLKLSTFILSNVLIIETDANVNTPAHKLQTNKLPPGLKQFTDKILMKKIICIIYLFIIPVVLPAQEKPLRVEIEAKAGSDSYVIIPFGEKGILLFYKSNESAGKYNSKWYFTLYDTNFKEKWTKEQPVMKDLFFKYFDYNDSCLYLYLENSVTAYSTGSFQILKINIDKEVIAVFNSVIKEKSVITGFKVINNVALLAGHTAPNGITRFGQNLFSLTLIPAVAGKTLIKHRTFLYFYNTDNSTDTVVSNHGKGQAYVDNLTKDDKDSAFVVSIKNHIPRKTNYMDIDGYNAGGIRISTLSLSTNNDSRKLNSAKLFAVSENEKIIIGTYNNNTTGNRANPAFAGFSEGSTGIYFCKIEGGEQKIMRFYNFSKFKNFYSYISERRTARMIKRAGKLEKQGKELSFDYKLLVHDIIERDSSYIMIAEAYYPEYHTVTYTNYDSYGRPVTVSYTVFDGYRYTNAIIACFDKNGELLWDNSFEIWNILTFNLKERVKVLIDKDETVLAYSSEGKIASKIISGNNVAEGKDYTRIETGFENDKLISDYNSDMEYWYGNYFISYGYQKIKNKTLDKTKRTVFYFNKIAFQ